MTALELIGWAGAASLLIGFVLNIFNQITATSVIYLLLNLVGSVLLLYNAWENEAYPFVVVNLIWSLFSIFKLVQKVVSNNSSSQ
ncbi:MAG: hypothetical protein JXR10_16710 [Cyclobacteriaceae bacterium]